MPESVTVTPGMIENTATVLFPVMVKLNGPGPLTVRLVLMVSMLLRLMVPVTLKLMVSPEEADAIAARNEPGPLSLVFDTVTTLAAIGTLVSSATTANSKPDRNHPRNFM